MDSELDTADAALNGICDDGGGNCTLRAAIQELNNNELPAEVAFDPAVTTIELTSVLPTIAVAMTIDGDGGRVEPVEILAAIPNSYDAFNVTANGVTLDGMMIGGSGAGFVNGVRLESDDNVVTGNTIEGNGTGVSLLTDADGSQIGGSGSEGNIIARNTADGVSVVGTSTGNSIIGNDIFDNAETGIDLGNDGSTANDGASDTDSGANDLQNTPVISGISALPPAVTFTLPSPGGSSYRVELFTGCTTAPGNNEGTFLDAISGYDPADGPETVLVTVPVGTRFSATATDSAGNTSEFSPCSAALPAPPPPSPPPPPPPPPGRVSAACTSGLTCTATPPSGPDTLFSVTASGGKANATLIAHLNGGTAPDCRGYEEHASDWLRFEMDGNSTTWTKKVALTLLPATSKKKAEKLAKKTQVCFGAPYVFTTRSGFKLTYDEGAGEWLGVLPDCKTSWPKQPCVKYRTVIKSGDSWLAQLRVAVPATAADPRLRW